MEREDQERPGRERTHRTGHSGIFKPIEDSTEHTGEDSQRSGDLPLAHVTGIFSPRCDAARVERILIGPVPSDAFEQVL
jgi:hypothetical protein